MTPTRLDEDGGRPREEQWKDLALSTFGGNESRAEDAARAAMAAQSSGKSTDEAFSAARAAYQGGSSATNVATVGDATTVVRPTGGMRSLVRWVTAAVLGALASYLRFGSQDLWLTIVIMVGVIAVVRVLAMRCRVTVTSATMIVQSSLLRRTLDRSAVQQLVVQPWSPWWRFSTVSLVPPPFVATFEGDAGTILLRMRQGPWTRKDMDRLGEAARVRVSQDRMP